jgi:diketogulonate reductase-like aldo/keto reductase
MKKAIQKRSLARAPRRRPKGAFSRDGVDLTLIHWMLSMTPAQRLRTLENTLRSLQKVRSEDR